jgi:hypothetical protein
MRFNFFSSVLARSRARQRRFSVPRLEVLEDRALPSTLTVLNTADSGPGSLRAAIDGAHDGDTIVFASALQGGSTITLTKQLAVAKNLDIEGPGAANLTVSGNDSTRLFDISGQATVTIAGLTITHGLATKSTRGILEPLDNPAVVGGGIFNEPGASLTLSHCTLTNNQAVGGNADIVLGGALMNEGDATVIDCTFSGNLAKGGFGVGGAIENLHHLTLRSSTFTGNQAAALTFNSQGGALDNTDGTADVTGCSFTDNISIGLGPGAEGPGGAIVNWNATDIVGGTILTITGCTFTGNRAIGGAGGDGVNTQGWGNSGAMDTLGGVTIIRDSSFTANEAIGGILLPGAASASGGVNNMAFGGAMKFDGANLDNILTGYLVVSNTVFSDNAAIGAPGVAGNAGQDGRGGALEIQSGNATITGCTFVGNVAQGGAGGSGARGGRGLGGALDVNDFTGVSANDFTGLSATAAVTNCTFIANEAVGGAGGSGANGGDGIGGAVAVATEALLGFPDPSSLTLRGSTLAGNFAEGGAGGVGGLGGDGLGGALAVLGGSSSATDSTFRNNVALGDEGGNGLGGAIYVGSGAALSVAASEIVHNQAQGDGEGVGGGVYSLGLFTFDAFTVIRKNHASTSNDDLFQ